MHHQVVKNFLLASTVLALTVQPGLCQGSVAVHQGNPSATSQPTTNQSSSSSGGGASQTGAIRQPSIKPAVNQYGELADLSVPDRTWLASIFFLQLAASVAVAIALMGWWSVPPKRRTP